MFLKTLLLVWIGCTLGGVTAEDPRDILHEWLDTEVLLEDEREDFKNSTCHGSPGVIAAADLLVSLVQGSAKASGILTRTWPHYHSFYKAHLAPLFPTGYSVISRNTRCQHVEKTSELQFCRGGEANNTQHNRCVPCANMTATDGLKWKGYCEKTPLPQPEGPGDPQRLKELEDLQKILTAGGTPGRLTGDEVLELRDVKLAELFEKCDATPAMSLAMRYLMESRLGWSEDAADVLHELELHKEFYGEKLEGLRGSKGRGFCRGASRLDADQEGFFDQVEGVDVCGPDGLCISCGDVMPEAKDKQGGDGHYGKALPGDSGLMKACRDLERAGKWEKGTGKRLMNHTGEGGRGGKYREGTTEGGAAGGVEVTFWNFLIVPFIASLVY